MTHHWTPDRLIHYPLIEHVNLAPDGRRVLYTVRRAHLTDEASEFRRQLFLADLNDSLGKPVALTHGESVVQPQWSPDGRWIAFLRKANAESKNGGKPGLWLMSARGGEARCLTGEGNGVRNAVNSFRWSPDGTRMALVSVPWDEAKEARRKGRDDAKQWRVDFDFPHLHILDLGDNPLAFDKLPPVQQLTHGRLAVMGMGWSPDGARLAFTHMPTPEAGSWSETRLAAIASDGSESEPTDVAPIQFWPPTPQYSPNGHWIACETGAAHGHWTSISQMVLYPTPQNSTHQTPVTLAEVSDNQPQLLGWQADSSAVYIHNRRGLDSEILSLPADGGEPKRLVNGEGRMGTPGGTVIHVNASGQCALARQTFEQPLAVEVVDLQQDEPPRVVAAPGVDFASGGPLPQVETLSWQSEDGLDIEGILYLPQGYDRARDGRIPLLLHIHGGPMALFYRQFSAAPYYYTPAAVCERGLAMLRVNPRGSGGYGAEFREANRRDWGGGDYRDLMQGVDKVIEMGVANADRLGVCGWSYGGFMTSWIITQTDRFVAASIGAPVTNPMSFTGTADIPGFIQDFFGAEPWQDFEFYQAHSPIFHVANVETPALIQHGEADVRVPIEQGLQFYNALHRRDVETAMYIYPRQGHAIEEPKLLRHAMEKNLDWFEERLKSEEHR